MYAVLFYAADAAIMIQCMRKRCLCGSDAVIAVMLMCVDGRNGREKRVGAVYFRLDHKRTHTCSQERQLVMATTHTAHKILYATRNKVGLVQLRVSW